jgi:hypothetical protein
MVMVVVTLHRINNIIIKVKRLSMYNRSWINILPRILNNNNNNKNLNSKMKPTQIFNRKVVWKIARPILRKLMKLIKKGN